MSYCRWSSMDYGCDLYCYESCDGDWVTHVAGNRCVGDVPHVDWGLLADNIEEFQSAHQRQHEFLETCGRENIGLPHDGMTFSDKTVEEFRDRLVQLRECGYRFPDEVFAWIDSEIAEKTAAQERPTREGE